jgi:hypothetical protein
VVSNTKLFEWLPSSADLHEKFRAVKLEKNTNKKITELTPLLFISFYWLFLANLLWVLISFVIEILSWPNFLLDYSSNVPVRINDFIKNMMLGLTWGRSILFLFLTSYSALCFFRGLRIAKQCWDVYKSNRSMKRYLSGCRAPQQSSARSFVVSGTVRLLLFIGISERLGYGYTHRRGDGKRQKNRTLKITARLWLIADCFSIYCSRVKIHNLRVTALALCPFPFALWPRLLALYIPIHDLRFTIYDIATSDELSEFLARDIIGAFLQRNRKRVSKMFTKLLSYPAAGRAVSEQG